MFRTATRIALFSASAFWASLVFAADPEFALTIKNHLFTPSEVRVPAGSKIRLLVTNADASAEEFESKSLKREKLVAGGATATIVVGPLKPGRYDFVGEFHEATAKGVIIAE